jgi:hypothetical protein
MLKMNGTHKKVKKKVDTGRTSGMMTRVIVKPAAQWQPGCTI